MRFNIDIKMILKKWLVQLMCMVQTGIENCLKFFCRGSFFIRVHTQLLKLEIVGESVFLV